MPGAKQRHYRAPRGRQPKKDVEPWDSGDLSPRTEEWMRRIYDALSEAGLSIESILKLIAENHHDESLIQIAINDVIESHCSGEWISTDKRSNKPSVTRGGATSRGRRPIRLEDPVDIPSRRRGNLKRVDHQVGSKPSEIKMGKIESTDVEVPIETDDPKPVTWAERIRSKKAEKKEHEVELQIKEIESPIKNEKPLTAESPIFHSTSPDAVQEVSPTVSYEQSPETRVPITSEVHPCSPQIAYPVMYGADPTMYPVGYYGIPPPYHNQAEMVQYNWSRPIGPPPTGFSPMYNQYPYADQIYMHPPMVYSSTVSPQPANSAEKIESDADTISGVESAFNYNPQPVSPFHYQPLVPPFPMGPDSIPIPPYGPHLYGHPASQIPLTSKEREVSPETIRQQQIPFPHSCPPVTGYTSPIQQFPPMGYLCPQSNGPGNWRPRPKVDPTNNVSLNSP
eukprot:GHVH01011071.1.p1 GENE.GHVH01011071.1~~GHVH01011071.1.p1  ORF type:complete len:452 (-),score=42.07 GHVH01011071.1:28-1383(-)